MVETSIKTNKLSISASDSEIIPRILDFLDPEESVTIKYTDDDRYEFTFLNYLLFDDVFDEETLSKIKQM